ncbi:tail associated protein [Bacillus phage vB_BceH_LY2]|nr:tail associated protein [Bacillus phage vB_BceH_LY2]
MADLDLSVSPYYDRFKGEQNRTKVLFQPDRPLQQSELNEMQSIQSYQLGNIGDVLFEDGSIQSKMDFLIDKANKKITVRDGSVYLAGKIRTFKEQTVKFNGVGVETIGVKLKQRIITSVEDPSLLDPTQGVDSYLSTGADRLEETVELTYNDEEAPYVFEFENGVLTSQKDRNVGGFNDILALRTYEESGSYQVQGFQIWTEESQEANKVDLLVDSGIAYVLGYRIQKPTSTRIPINRSIGTRDVAQETHSYDPNTKKIRVGSSSVKDITQVVGRALSPTDGISMTKGSQDGRDAIPPQYTSIERTTVVLTTTNPVKTYKYNDDYTIVEENGIQYVDWNTGLNGTEPVAGTTYNIKFEYDAILKQNIDFKITKTPYSDSTPGWDTYIDFNGLNGIKPKDGGIVRLSYNFYLSREDIITLDKKGRFTVIEGQPDRVGFTSPPEHNDPVTLRIGKVRLYPNSAVSDAVNDGTFRLRMEDIQRMEVRLKDVEYNQAMLALENQATNQDDPLALRGVFADAFVDFSRMDLALSSVAVSFDDASITLMADAPTDQTKSPTFLKDASTAKSWGRIVTAPFTEVKEVTQPFATEAMNVNPYAVYNKMGALTLTPPGDQWIEENKITINKEETQLIRVATWWRFMNDAEYDKIRNIVDPNSRTGTITNVSQTFRDEAIEFIRQRDVEFECGNLIPMSRDYWLSFDGVKVPVTPLKSSSVGSSPGTINADGSGKAYGKFTIPPNVRTGTREVVLQNASNQAITTYTAHGTKRNIEETVLRTRVTVNVYDPLAQSFVLPQDKVVTSFDLYFASKSATDNIIVQVRGTTDDNAPSNKIFAERLLTPADIKVSADGSVATKIALDDPLLCKGGQVYCIVVITDSMDYTMWTATLGKPLVDNPATTVVTQPYVAGVLFSSSNALNWTVHNNSDMKFSIYTAIFQEEAIAEFETMSDLDSDMMVLMADYLTPANTGCIWEVKWVNKRDVGTISIDAVPWQPIANYIEKKPQNDTVGLVKLRATFKSNRYISPMLSLEYLSFVNFVSAMQGDYVSRNINSSEAPFNYLTLSYDASIPQQTSVTPKFSVDGGTTWQTFTDPPKVVRQSAEFNRYTYSKKISTFATNTQIRLKLELRASNRFVSPRVKRFTAVFKDV